MTLRLLFTIFCSVFISVGANAAGAAAAKEAGPASVYLPIEPISVAMYNKRKRLAGTMTIVMQLQIEDQEKREAAIKIMPRLKSAYMQETVKLSLNFFDINRPVNLNILSRSLQNVTNGVLRHNQARVLIGDVAIYKR